MRLLCVGDIHLGRQPGRLPPELSAELDVSGLSPAGAWHRTVETAVKLQVDAVILTGDVVDRNDDFFEAYADLQRGTATLAEHRIAVIGVSGNHDVLVLPRLAEALPEFRLLGQGGQWEVHTLEDTAGVRVNLLGWSFPQEAVTHSPLRQSLPPASDGLTIGLLHCDRDQHASRYAPVTSAELAAAPVDAWLLGHIHKPDSLAGDRPMGYLGSLTALDPGEPGAHGPWLLDYTPEGGLVIEHLPLAPLRWETVDVPLDGMDAPEDVHRRITDALDELHADISAASHHPDAVGCRVRLVGRTPYRQAVTRVLERDNPMGLTLHRGGIAYFVERWRNEALPAIDLTALAAGNDPVALLARKILALQNPESPQRRDIVEALRERLRPIAEHGAFRPLEVAPPDDDEAAALGLQAALRALDTLLAQQAVDA